MKITPDNRAHHYTKREEGKIKVLGRRGLTRQGFAEQIHKAMWERAALMRPPVLGRVDRLPAFDELTDAERSVCFAVADLFIDRASRAIHALEFYRDATKTALEEDYGMAARRALAGKRA